MALCSKHALYNGPFWTKIGKNLGNKAWNGNCFEMFVVELRNLAQVFDGKKTDYLVILSWNGNVLDDVIFQQQPPLVILDPISKTHFIQNFSIWTPFPKVKIHRLFTRKLLQNQFSSHLKSVYLYVHLNFSNFEIGYESS